MIHNFAYTYFTLTAESAGLSFSLQHWADDDLRSLTKQILTGYVRKHRKEKKRKQNEGDE